MASSNTRQMRGSFRGTGSALNVRTVGFRPRYIRLINTAGPDEASWHVDMADDSMHKRIAAGTGSMVTSGGITPLSDGFTLGNDADMNASGELVHYVAEE